MGTFLKTILVILLMVGSFAGGWFASNEGYRLVDSNGGAVVKGNAAQIVKDENARLSREVIGKSFEDAESFLKANNRTLFAGVTDGKLQERSGQKTFTNLTVEVKNDKVVKALGWY